LHFPTGKFVLQITFGATKIILRTIIFN